MATVESMVVEEQREPEKPVDREKVATNTYKLKFILVMCKRL